MTIKPQLLRLPLRLVLLIGAVSLTPGLTAQTNLADAPVLSSSPVPGNLALALSVEFPTALVTAYPTALGRYNPANESIGYFDPNKCYTYNATGQFFQPAGLVTTPNVLRTCTGQWSGNFLNWATMQTIDPFRWVLTGGYRSTDTESLTVLQRAFHSGQNNWLDTPDRGTIATDANARAAIALNAADIPGATPFPATAHLLIRNHGQGFDFRIIASANPIALATLRSTAANATTPLPSTPPLLDVVYLAAARVRVCDSSPAAGGLEDNCTQYPNGNYKPTGLLQKYSQKMRYAAFGYLNDGTLMRDGGVLRSRMKYVGPTMPVPGNPPVVSPNPEWNADNGVLLLNPNPTDVADSASTYTMPAADIPYSGVINYLNRFGQDTRTYKTFDPVGEMYYAALRYFRKLDNVPEWSYINPASSPATKKAFLDGFPVINDWYADGHDPILYSCQKNFVLGIGDNNTHADRNLPGSTSRPSEPPAIPAFVAADTFTKDVMVSTQAVGEMQPVANLATRLGYPSCCNNNGALMAGLAYDANTTDIRAETAPRGVGSQTVQTYWLDVIEGGFQPNNQFYLAAKYGGFDVPSNFGDPYSRLSTDIPLTTWWKASNGNIPTTSIKRPNTYFTAASARQMVDGLSQLFSNIVAASTVVSTSASTSFPQVSSAAGLNVSYASSYSAEKWTGELAASRFDYGMVNNPNNANQQIPGFILTPLWRFSEQLSLLAAGTGWSDRRRILTYNTSTNKGVAFRSGAIHSTQLSDLDTVDVSANDSVDFLNYLRGDRSNEIGVAANGVYRSRVHLLGDIVNSTALPIGRPSSGLTESTNPGYSAFKTAHSLRPPMVLVGTNQGMLHVINGAETVAAGGGRELFAYIPSALFKGPSSPSTPSVNGLQALGKQNFTHYNFVDAEPAVMDVDFGKTGLTHGGADWRTVAIGGLGKGGRALYALNITTVPADSVLEASLVDQSNPAANRVLWEINAPPPRAVTIPAPPDRPFEHLGFTYSPPAIFKTRKWGWVALVGSGHNPHTGKGVFYFINPKTGEQLEAIDTGVGTAANPAGLSAVMAFIPDPTDGTADMVYAGDLQGNLWRLDVSGTGPYPAPIRLAKLRGANNAELPVTARPYVVVEPGSNKRWVTIGTGRLLHDTDKGSTQSQRFFAIWDGFVNKAADQIEFTSTPRSYPVESADLQQLTNLQQRTVLDSATKIGWFVELGNSVSGAGFRVISDASSSNGAVTFAAISPSSTDPCSQGGIGRIYAIDLESGQSILKNRQIFIDRPNMVNGSDFISVGGQTVLKPDENNPSVQPIDLEPPAALKLRRLNWREVPQME